MLGLVERPHGWSFSAVQDELGIGERTLMRYLAACRKEVTDRFGKPIVEVVRYDKRRLLRLARPSSTNNANAYEVLYLYFALSVFQFLEGTVIKEGIDHLWERFYRGLPKQQRLRLGDFPRKFYVVPHAVKDYRRFDDILDTIVQCLVYQHRMIVDYHGLVGEGRIHEIDPYTLAMYRGGLYLIGYSYVYRKVIYLAIERIRSVEKRDETFSYPARYSPQKHTEGVFGIFDGPPCDVELQLLNKETVAYLRSRRLHPSQKFIPQSDGTVRLTMSVRGTTELVPWILSHGPYVRVLQPRELRDEVASLHAQASALYARSPRKSLGRTSRRSRGDTRASEIP